MSEQDNMRDSSSPSSKRHTSIPFRARSANALTIIRPASSSPRMNVEMWMLRWALPISARNRSRASSARSTQSTAVAYRQLRYW